MNNISQVLDSLSSKSKPRANSNKKRKWREIEQIRDKFQLERELKVYESSLEHLLEDF